MGDRDFTITIGSREVKALVPLHLYDRHRVIDALAICGENYAVVACCAMIGACWADDEDLDVPSLRTLGGDLIEYGQHVYDALYSLGLDGHIVAPAMRIREVVTDSIPTQAEVEEAADFTAAREADSIATT